jgi:hypothetical protein
LLPAVSAWVCVTLPDGFQAVPGYAYWVFVKGKFQKANSTKQLMAAIPGKKEKIMELVKKNNSNFANKPDMVQLLMQF